MSAPKAIARLAGMVQGVVVQITTLAPARAPPARPSTGNFTHTVGETWS
jgi:hypothetical protein